MPLNDPIRADELLPLIGACGAPDIIDVRLPEDLESDPVVVPGARHLPYSTAATHADAPETVVICQKGKKLSQVVAAEIALTSQHACILEGGMQAWLNIGGPVVLAWLPERWVTPHYLSTDALFSIWMIRRFARPTAVFLPVDEAESKAAAEFFNVGVIETEPFQQMAALGLTLPPLARAIERLGGLKATLGAGLEKIARGHTAQLNRMLPIFDAHYEMQST